MHSWSHWSEPTQDWKEASRPVTICVAEAGVLIPVTAEGKSHGNIPTIMV